ncbi:DUF6676 family protein [Corynebacterium callunae]|uniref:Rv1476 family membrane protein n=1 Tax=Corynebacterium callunae TaxID=1721 RepID=UPI001FFE98A9|nr:hypothetical protein [Corynebacterium callunae]
MEGSPLIPEDIDIADLAQDLNKDAVMVGPHTASEYPQLEHDLVEVAKQAQAGDFGSVGLVYLDKTPPMTSDLRDIAQELLNTTDFETVVVRSPESGAVVSDIHSRAVLEIGQGDMLATPDYAAGAQALIEDVTQSSVGAIDWTAVTVMGLVVLTVLLVVIALAQWGLRRKSQLSSL